MELDGYKKLESKVKKPEFGEDFKSLNLILRVLSIFGNISSIFLASFFISQLLGVAVENEIIQWVIAIIALTGLELTKREIFFRFSRDFIRTNSIFKKSVLPMLLFTMLLISMSFYSSLSGAKEFSSKSDQIEVIADKQIDTFTDSTSAFYQDKIDILEQQNQELFDENKKLNEEARELPSNWISSKQRIRSNIQLNNQQIEKNDDKISNLKDERDSVVKTYKSDILKESGEEKEKNQDDSKVFILISTLIEFLILIGIYFNNLFNFKSYKDIKSKLLNDDNFRTYYNYSEILEVLYLNNKEKDRIPSIDLMVELLVMNKVYLTKEQVEKSLTLFDALKIIETNGDHTYLLKDKEESLKVIKNHFHIK